MVLHTLSTADPGVISCMDTLSKSFEKSSHVGSCLRAICQLGNHMATIIALNLIQARAVESPSGPSRLFPSLVLKVLPTRKANKER